jgi:hypothetical protein
LPGKIFLLTRHFFLSHPQLGERLEFMGANAIRPDQFLTVHRKDDHMLILNGIRLSEGSPMSFHVPTKRAAFALFAFMLIECLRLK